ncbi:MAG: helix-turn-helix transcriptional regulator [Rhodospirillales bacterium]|nr:helix-turn-helix transcriptional regulator [Rhodospirillales bacterium]
MAGHRTGARSGSGLHPADEVPNVSLRDRKKAQQRSQLLEVALELFRHDGFEKTRMEDIAARAMVSTPTVYITSPPSARC